MQVDGLEKENQDEENGKIETLRMSVTTTTYRDIFFHLARARYPGITLGIYRTPAPDDDENHNNNRHRRMKSKHPSMRGTLLPIVLTAPHGNLRVCTRTVILVVVVTQVASKPQDTVSSRDF
jgi:hypothetical protein